MGSLYVCGRCARRLALLKRKLSRSYVSLRGRERRNEGGVPQAERWQDIPFRFDDNPEGRHCRAQRLADEKSLQTLFSSNRTTSEQPTRSIDHGGPKATVKILPNVWTSPFAPAAQPAPSPTPTIIPTPDIFDIIAQPDKMEEDRSVGRSFDMLENLLEHNAPLNQIWKICQKIVHGKGGERGDEATDRIKDADIKVLHAALSNICKRSHRMNEGHIAPSAVIRLFLQYGVMGRWWQECLYIMLARFVELRYGSLDGSKDDATLAEMKWLLQDIIEVWRLFLKKLSGQFSPASSLDNENEPKKSSSARKVSNSGLDRRPVFGDDKFFGWPDLVRSRKETIDQTKSLAKRFLQLVPTDYFSHASRLRVDRDDRENLRNIAAASAMTLDCLRYAKTIIGLGEALPEDARPFNDFLESVVGQLPTAYKTAMLGLAKNNVPQQTIEKALGHWIPGIRERPALNDGNDFAVAKVDRVATMISDLDEAVKTSNSSLAMQVWTRAQRHLSAQHLDRDPAKLENLYAQLLSTFFGLRRTETATSVWNYMVQRGQKITTIHWTAMLHGCVRAHDVLSLREIWDKMLRSNIAPDTATWTTYIRGLIKCKQWREGIEALNELGRTWKTDTNKKSLRDRRHAGLESSSPEESQPSLAPVKAALDALIDIERADLVDPILNWASTHGLHPDTHIYNILLRPVARAGNPTAIQSHLTTMSANNCQPDITTFTIILSSIVSSPDSKFHTLNPSEQAETVISILNDMHAAAIPPNTYTYSALVSVLLQTPSPKHKYHSAQPGTTTVPKIHTANISAARTVLAHMRTHSIVPTPHIYTTVLSHYFSQSPPDLSAIHSLWRSLQSAPPGSPKLADPIFYDRMIVGLAEAGQAEESLAFVKQMAKEGQVPGWVALGKCLEALYGSRQIELLRWLVVEVEREGGLVRWGERDSKGSGWWQRRVGQLRREGLVPERIEQAGEHGGGTGGVENGRD